MGWNSWNLANCAINETFFRATVDALASKGYLEAGYQYINLDDCWMDTERDTDGNLQWGPNFPTGNTLGDYIHSKGLLCGIYTDVGPKTCAGYEGSFNHDEIDAKTYAEWYADLAPLLLLDISTIGHMSVFYGAGCMRL